MSKRWPTVGEVFFSGRTNRSGELQEEYEKNFFRSIRLRNGVYKTTYSNRLDDLNELTNSVLPQGRPLHLMDVAISSGVSTWEWIRCLESAGIDHAMVAGDFTVDAILTLFSERLSVLTDRQSYPLLFQVFGLGIPSSILILWRAPHLIPIHLICRFLYALFSLKNWRRSDREVVEFHHQITTGIPRSKSVSLLSPRLLECPYLEIVEDDITRPSQARFKGQFHVIRAANILQRGYFGQDMLSEIVSNLRARLRKRGLLIVCRTDKKGLNRGTIFRLTDSGSFEIAARLPKASEIEALILDLPPDP